MDNRTITTCKRGNSSVTISDIVYKEIDSLIGKTIDNVVYDLGAGEFRLFIKDGPIMRLSDIKGDIIPRIEFDYKFNTITNISDVCSELTYLIGSPLIVAEEAEFSPDSNYYKFAINEKGNFKFLLGVRV